MSSIRRWKSYKTLCVGVAENHMDYSILGKKSPCTNTLTDSRP
jgi:hypothetical protein